jgi:hypothetical protein
MGFASMDDFVSKVTQDGQFRRTDWNKAALPTTVQVAGTWYSLARGGGNPAAETLLGTGTNLTMQAGWHDVTPNANGLWHGGNVTPATKHLINMSAFSASVTTCPAVIMLVDMLAHIPITTTTTITSQVVASAVNFTADNATNVITHTGYDIATFSKVQLTTSGTLPAPLALATDYWTIRVSATTSRLAASLADAVASVPIDLTTDGVAPNIMTIRLPRYSDGVGVQVFHTPSTVMGVGTPSFSFGSSGYTNSAGTAGRAIPTSPALPALTPSAPVGMIDHSGTGAGKFGPFLPLASGDAGIRSVQSIQYSATRTSGVGNIVFCKPIVTLPLSIVGYASERDLLNQLPSLPQIQDGACLHWIMYAGAATPVNSPYYGHLDFGWG